MIVKIDLTPESIQNALDELEKYKAWIDRKTEELVRRFGEIGVEITRTNFEQAQYAGDNDVQVRLDDLGERRVAVVAYGDATWFIEFGTGVTFTNPHPEASKFGAVRGGYGQGRGANPRGWSYTGIPGQIPPPETEIRTSKKGKQYVHTKGNPSGMCMYLAEEELRQRFKEIAQEVFAGE